MDPVSVSGLAIGATSLAFQIFAGCVKGYQLFIDMDNMPETYEHLRVRLRIEQSRFLDWGDKIGLVDDLLEPPTLGAQLHRGSVLPVLLQIQRVFKECIHIEAKFDKPLGIVTQWKEDKSTISASQGTNVSERRNVLLQKTLHLLDKTMWVQKKLKWAMVKHEMFERLIHELISFNDSIVSLLDRNSIEELQDLQLQNQLITLQLCTKVDELRQLSWAMQYKTAADNQKETLDIVSTTPGLMTANRNAINDTLASLASFKARHTSLDSDPALAKVQLTSLSDINLLEDTSTRSQATWRGKLVWIEWKHVEPDARTKEKISIIEQRIKKLTLLLAVSAKPALFRGPDCVGFCRDMGHGNLRYGLIFERPLNQSPSDPYVSLLALVRGRNKISLTRRIRLAHSLAQSLMYLHSVNWLHKGLRSDNIIFFASSDQETDMDSPTIVGFEYARPDGSDEETDKPRGGFEHNQYRHPAVLGAHNPRSHKSHDIYSLGVILIEIAIWRPVQDIVTEIGVSVTSRMRISKFRQALLDRRLLANVEMHAGEIYRQVVERCLLGGLAMGIPPSADESSPAVGAAMLTSFVEGVVAPLKNIRT